jgi:hypothetical protein
MWFSHRMHIRPGCAPVATHVQGGGVEMSNGIRLAA